MRAASVAVDAHNVLLASMRKPRNFGDHEAAKKFTRDRRKARATHRPARVVHLNKMRTFARVCQGILQCMPL